MSDLDKKIAEAKKLAYDACVKAILQQTSVIVGIRLP